MTAVDDPAVAAPRRNRTNSTTLATGEDMRTLETIRRGVHHSPELKEGLVGTLLLAVIASSGQVVVPIAVQQTLDRGLNRPGGPDTSFTVLLGLLADDPTLEPRDILVMCPDIETYAPLITARFGLADVVSGGHPAHRLRVQLADRAVSRTNPLLGVAEQLLAVAGSRAQASLVLDLAQHPPVRRRFGFSDDDLDAMTTWTRESGVRWGFDAEHRAPYGVDYVQNTWRFGLDRVLAGVALSDDAAGWLGATLPLDDVGSNRVELAGRFAELVDRLVTITDGLTGTRTLHEWITTLIDGVTSLTSVAHADSWQVGHLQRELSTVLAQAEARADSVTC